LEKLKGLTATGILIFIMSASLLSSSQLAIAQAPLEKEVVVYSSNPTDVLEIASTMFTKKYGVAVMLVKGGTGELMKRIEAEAASPLGDVFWSGAIATLRAYKKYFEPYVSPETAAYPTKYKDPEGIITITVIHVMVIMYNKDLVKEEEKPKGWKDLTDPKWEGKIAYADPAKSGSAYAQLITVLQILGKGDAAWKTVEEMTINCKVLASSGAVYKGVADGEYHLGITMEYAAYKYVAEGKKVGIIYPAEGTSADPEGGVVIKGGKNPRAARLFIDFVASKELREELLRKTYRRPVRPDVDVPSIAPGLPSLRDLKLIEYDEVWAEKERSAILDKFKGIVVRADELREARRRGIAEEEARRIQAEKTRQALIFGGLSIAIVVAVVAVVLLKRRKRSG